MTKAERCYQDIKDAIMDGHLLPGTSLVIDKLKSQYQVSGSAIREALSRLSNTGFVVAQSNKGFSVAPVSADEVRDLYVSYFEIEKTCLLRAMRNGDRFWEGEILSCLHQLKVIETSPGTVDYLEWYSLNKRFHEILVSQCDLKYLLQMRHHLFQLLERYMRYYIMIIGADLQMNHEEHDKLAKLVIKRDEEQAVVMLEEHITSGVNVLVTKLSENGFFGEGEEK